MKSRQAQNIKRHNHHKRATAKTPTPQVYPPPVMTVSPDSLNGLFSNMDERQWGVFMQVLEEQIQNALSCGKFRQALKGETVPMSCPRF